MSDFSRMMELAMAANATKTNEALGVVPAEPAPASHPPASTTAASSPPPPKK